MAIFSTKNVATESTVEHVEYDIQPTMEASDAILYEFAEDMYKIQAGLYVADVMIEQAVSEGAAPEALVEGTVGDFFKKIGAAIKKLWDKVVAWFKSIIENIRVLFSSGEAFIKKYENVIRQKKDNGFTYVGYKYLPFDNIDDPSEDIVDQAEEFIDIINTIDPKSTKDNLSDEVNELYKMTDSEFKTMILSELADNRADNISELKTDLINECRSGMLTTKELTFSTGNSKDEMINIVKNYKKMHDTIIRYKSSVDKAMRKAINSINSAESKFKNNSDILPVISNLVNKFKFTTSVSQSFMSMSISMHKEIYRSYLGTLKRFVMWKPAKESFEVTETGSKSILESAMELI